MKIGYACADITPVKFSNITLSGFVARENKPVKGIDDHIWVHCFVISIKSNKILVLVYDLLALGDYAVQIIDKAIGKYGIPANMRILTCTHNHSAPATIVLNGSGIIDKKYVDFVAQKSSSAVFKAMNNMVESIIRPASKELQGCNVNRRLILKNGKVVEKAPKADVLRKGPELEIMSFFLVETIDGTPVVGITHWASHPNIVCNLSVTADYPGELCRRLQDRYGFPFIYLQGACGNLNSLFLGQTREKMMSNVDVIMSKLSDEILWESPLQEEDFWYVRYHHILHYQKIPSINEIKQIRTLMREVENKGFLASSAALAEIANVLCLPQELMYEAKYRYVAGVLSGWAESLLELETIPETTKLTVSLLGIGNVIFCFLAGEIFSETQIKLQQMFEDKNVIVVGYCSPLRGYIPTDEALETGGYESEIAYRFYGHPAPFAEGTEESLLNSVNENIRVKKIKYGRRGENL